jgi:hypothetical protein
MSECVGCPGGGIDCADNCFKKTQEATKRAEK